VARRDRRPASANVLRARQLLAGGAMGGHAAALIVIGVLYFVRGPGSLASSALTALAVLAFFGVGQLVQIRVADAAPQVVLTAALASYAFRVGLPALALIAVSSDPQRLAGMDRVAVAVTAIVVVLGWLAAEIWTFSRLRIPVFDRPEDDPR
jgi:ATP synthase protein I